MALSVICSGKYVSETLRDRSDLEKVKNPACNILSGRNHISQSVQGVIRLMVICKFLVPYTKKGLPHQTLFSISDISALKSPLGLSGTSADFLTSFSPTSLKLGF